MEILGNEDTAKRLMDLYEGSFGKKVTRILWYTIHPLRFLKDIRAKDYINIIESESMRNVTEEERGNLLEDTVACTITSRRIGEESKTLVSYIPRHPIRI